MQLSQSASSPGIQAKIAGVMRETWRCGGSVLFQGFGLSVSFYFAMDCITVVRDIVIMRDKCLAMSTRQKDARRTFSPGIENQKKGFVFHAFEFTILSVA